MLLNSIIPLHLTLVILECKDSQVLANPFLHFAV